MYKAPEIHASADASVSLRDLPGRVLVCTMELPWDLLHRQIAWSPNPVHFVKDMDLATLESLDATLPECDVVVGVGGGSSVDTAKYLAWKRGCRMVLVPTIISVDAPFTNMVGVRVDNKVQYVGDIFPEEIVIDYALIRNAPPELNRAGACDIASIHTALHDWKLAHDARGERYDEDIAEQARQCLSELDQNAAEVYAVSPKGIDTVVDLYRREVKFCAELGSSRPEEGAEHIVAYNMEHITKRHFVHGDLVGLGIFVISRLQGNAPDYATDLMERCGLRYRCPDASDQEIRQAIETLRAFKEEAGLFYSVVDEQEVTPEFTDSILAGLGRM